MSVLQWAGEHWFLAIVLSYFICQSSVWILMAPFKHCKCCSRR